MNDRLQVAVLGCTGMLGAMTLDSLSRSGKFDLVATCRDPQEATALKEKYPSVEFRSLDAEKASIGEVSAAIAGSQWVINCIGIIKPYIHDDNAAETERAIRVNSLFPYLLGQAASIAGAKVIQIATDCVYSGEKGEYIETDVHDALDVYGKSKSLGEAHLDTVWHVRCSIIGPELKAHLSLMDWFLGQDKGASVNGFSNHHWNGVTTLHFARVCEGIITGGIEISHVQHIVPSNLITKANLLRSFAKEFDRGDIVINEVEAPKVVDRTLTTKNQDLNMAIWKAAGYATPPTVEQMVAELAEYNFTQGNNK